MMGFSLLASRYTVALGAVAALLLGTWWHGHSQGYDAGFAAEQKKYDAHIAADAAADENARRTARLYEYHLALAQNAASNSYEEGKRDAEANANTLAAELRAGTVRLHRRWAGCEAERRADTAAHSGELDAGAQDRAASAGRIVRAAAECDAQVRGLQAILMAERSAAEATP